MQNVHEILKKYGVEVPTEHKADFDKDMLANYKTVTEVEKKLGKVEGERDNYKEQLETAQETLKSFEGVDLATIQNELATWKTKAENAEKDYNAKLEARDFEDALKAEIAAYKFSSTAAKNSVMDEIRAKGLKASNGKILGLSDFVKEIAERDPSAFVTEREENRARFAEPKPINNPTGAMTKAEIMGIKDRDQRRAAIAANLNLFNKQ